MADNPVDFDSNNLCTTQDAFEDFQANTMYKKDDYITLADILPPRLVIPDVNKCLEDMPSEFDVNSFATPEIKDNITPSLCNFDIDSDQTHSKEISQLASLKVCETSLEDETKLKNTQSRKRKYVRRKGKKRKVCNKVGLNVGFSKNVRNEVKVAHNILPKSLEATESKEPEESVLISETVHKSFQKNVDISKVKKRGRPKKNLNVICNSELTNNNSSKDFDEIVATKDNSSLSENDKKPLKSRKRGKNIEILEDKKIVEANQQRNIQKSVRKKRMNLEKNTEKLDNFQSTELKKTLNRVKKRSLKPKSLKQLVNHNEKIQKENVDNEDLDDIVLSRLKQSCEEKKTAIVVDELSCNDKCTENVDKSQVEIDENHLDYQKEESLLNISESLSLSEEMTNQPINKKQRIKKKPLSPDFEYNIDKIVVYASEKEENGSIDEKDKEIEGKIDDSIVKPTTRRARKQIKYDFDSDEDPYANVELSDEEPNTKKRGYRYYSDEEYKPGYKHDACSESDSIAEDVFDEPFHKKSHKNIIQKHKKCRKKADSSLIKTSKKKMKISSETENTNLNVEIIPNVETISRERKNHPDDDIEELLQSTVITPKDDIKICSNKWGTTSEFENFLAKKIQSSDVKITKASKRVTTPLEIPIIDQNEPKKCIEICTQTDKLVTKTVDTQTTHPSFGNMKHNFPLTPLQSKNACEFLKNIVTTTTELGQLMVSKSQDFIKKKINPENVVDTFKMDYCVQKSFLLFKLAKHNLSQMEEDLAKKYEEFLETNGISSCRLEEKILEPKTIQKDDDSDCEIVDEQPADRKTNKPLFNPKTVFLNKELSIKIAKKSDEDKVKKENYSATKRNVVWINDSISVKKVKPSQSFLAQDSRNKKPPDCFVTLKMVNDFFNEYSRRRALNICAPLVSLDWTSVTKSVICHYFFIDSHKFQPSGSSSSICMDNMESVDASINTELTEIKTTDTLIFNPKSLVSLCTSVLQKCICSEHTKVAQKDSVVRKSDKKRSTANTLLQLCLAKCNLIFCNEKLIVEPVMSTPEISCDSSKKFVVISLKELSLKKVLKCISKNKFNTVNEREILCSKVKYNELCQNDRCTYIKHNCKEFSKISETSSQITQLSKKATNFTIISLKEICFEKIRKLIYGNKTNKSSEILASSNDIQQDDEVSFNEVLKISEPHLRHVKPVDQIHKKIIVIKLKTLCFRKIQKIFSSCEGQNEIEIDHNNETEQTIEHSLVGKYETLLQKKRLVDKADTTHFKTLFTLCFDSIDKYLKVDKQENSVKNYIDIKTLKEIALKKVLSLLDVHYKHLHTSTSFLNHTGIIDVMPDTLKLLSLKKVIEILRQDTECHSISVSILQKEKKVKTLANICFEYISLYLGNIRSPVYDTEHNETLPLTIGSINTLSEEAYHNIIQTSLDNNAGLMYDDNNFYEEELASDMNYLNENNEWISRVQIEEFSSDSVSVPNDECMQNIQKNTVNDPIEQITPIIARIKTELCDETQINFDDESNIEVNRNCSDQLIIIKGEPLHSLDEMTIIPENVVTKLEKPDHFSTDNMLCDSDHSTLESLRLGNLHGNVDNYEEIFSQSALRVRRQHEPDSDNENEYNMSLLIPQMYETMPVDVAKGSLMESSTDDETGDKKTKTKDKKKLERRRSRRGKKVEPKAKETSAKLDMKSIAKESPCKVDTKVSIKESPAKLDMKSNAKDTLICKDKTTINSDVAVLTRRMREKIRQEEKKVTSSDSEQENLPIKKKEKDPKKKSFKQMHEENEIQCHNIDSTGQVDVNAKKKIDEFSGFSAVDQNEIASYQKYVKFVYDKIMTTDEQGPKKMVSNIQNMDNSALFDPSHPVELLECEPTMPIFGDSKVQESRKKIKNFKKCAENSKKTEKNKQIEVNQNVNQNKEEKVQTNSQHSNKCSSREFEVDSIENTNINQTNLKSFEEVKPTYKERHGWHCYHINANDTKLYLSAHIPLEKLPETFVETYFKYQNITDRDEDDEEVDKLTNLRSLNRISSHKVKTRSKAKDKNAGEKHSLDVREDSKRVSPVISDHYDELEPSEDEGADIEDEHPPVPEVSTENCLAKSSLMTDHDSDRDELNTTKELPIKQEPIEEEDLAENVFANEESKKEVPRRKYKPGPKSRRKQIVNTDSLMLTADKMMNKELTLLHAPVVLTNEIQEISPKGDEKKKLKVNPKARVKRERRKSENESSEEEKQWVCTKEKLLKRLVKKPDNASVDEAKHAKIVSEYIEKRSSAPDVRKRKITIRKKRRSKKFLERQKQLSVLSKELFGESSTTAASKTSSSAYAKGRRNIRKVIDKKSLARSTVIANMEEFERKKRLINRQAKLREVLGCEENVNVLVINDEVCLEYDFDKQRPVVTVHPFFTKVMKAHQYEGVKFMWDACFESLENIENAHPGGGCILAHCMGLGKTLQVLALLHTVMTHPRVSMQRVLVCCPLSTVLNWVDEIHKWIGPVTDKIKVFELSKLKKTYERAYQLEDWYKGGGIFIIGYELFRSLTTLDPFLDHVKLPIINKIRTALLDPGPDIIICDEGHLLKNDCSVLAVSMSRVATRRRIVLTGTPMQNNLREYYCMVNFVKPNLLGTYAEYSNRFENPIMNGQHRDSQEEDIKLMKARTHILHKVLEGCLQRQEASVLYPYLPKKYEYTVFISLTQCQSDLYKHYLESYSRKTKQSILKDFHILQKIWTHPQVLHHFLMKSRDDVLKVKAEKLEDDLAREDLTASEDIKPGDTEVWWLQYLNGGNMLEKLESSNKLVAVFRILDECVALGDKVLIFSTSLFTMDVLEYFLKDINKWSLGQDYYRLDGSVPPEVRQQWCREFNAEHNVKTKVFLISTRAGSLGLNMTAANRVIILDTSWNPAHDIQSIFRVYRFGQKKDCYIYRLVALGTMEQKIYERSVTKQAVACRVVDEQQIDRHYNMAELSELYRFDELGLGVASGVAVGVSDVVLLRVARDASLHAVHEHDSLLRSSEQGLNEHERDAAWMQFQQEQAHKQMQNHLVPIIELKTPGQQLHSQYQNQDAQNKVKVEKTNEDVDYTPTSETKSRKGRRKKSTRVKPDIPPTTPHFDEIRTSDKVLEEEEILVEKISDILLKYNIQNRYGAKEISDLITRVKLIVASKDLSTLETCDGVTRNIAELLLEREKNNFPVMPALTDIVNTTDETAVNSKHDVSSNVPKIPKLKYKRGGRKKAKQGKKKVGYKSGKKIAEEPLINSNEIMSSGETNETLMAAESNSSAFATDPVINIDSDIDLDRSDTDSAPEIFDQSNNLNKSNIKQETELPLKRKIETVTRENELKSTKRKKITTSTSNRVKVQSEKNVANNLPKQEPIVEEDSIVLSDDDEPVIKSKGKVETSKVKSEHTEERILLHPSLLSNKNFIKIVAHTYLSGNPMLDEDAALLAAQYSTFKTLQEIKSTGKLLDSGPIYDIALKVLGRQTLKQLYDSENQNQDTSGLTPQSSSQSKLEQNVKCDQIKKDVAEKKSVIEKKDSTPLDVKNKSISKEEKSLISLKARPTSELMENKPKTRRKAASAVPSVTDVVPVGIFQATPNMQNSNPPVPSRQDSSLDHPFVKTSKMESILPNDEDDDIIISDQTLPQIPVPPLGQQPPHLVYKNLVKDESVSNLKVNQEYSSHRKIPQIRASSSNIIIDAVPNQSTITAAPNLVSKIRKIGPKSSFVVKDFISYPTPVALTVSSELPGVTKSFNKPTPVAITATSQAPVLLTNVVHNLDESRSVSDTMPTPVALTTNLMAQKSLSMVSSDITICLDSDDDEDKSEPVKPPPTNKQKQVTSEKSMTKLSTKIDSNLVASQKIDRVLKTPQKEESSINKVDSKVTQPKSTNSQPGAQKLQGKSGAQTMNSSNIEEKPSSKTVCRPGDIIRIGKGGKLEILNRGDESMETLLQNDSAASTTASKNVPSKHTVTKSPKIEFQQHGTHLRKDKVDTPPLRLAKEPPCVRTHNERIRKISSSSSGSASRSPSPQDPLAILKDVVHIQAPDIHKKQNTVNIVGTKLQNTTRYSKNQVSNKNQVSSNTQVSNKNQASNNTQVSNKNQVSSNTQVSNKNEASSNNQVSNKNQVSSKTQVSSKNQPLGKYVPTGDKGNTVSESSNKSDVILKQMNNFIDKKQIENVSTSKHSVKRPFFGTPTKSPMSTIDLTDTAAPSAKPNKNISLNNPPSVNKSTSSVPQRTRVVTILNRKKVSTVVGTSKDIIITAGGKSISKDATKVSTSSKPILVTKMETLPPSGKISNIVLKRPAAGTETMANKKKKTEMTLKDFNIEDIDDIIELD